VSGDAKVFAVIAEMDRGQLIDALEQGQGYDPLLLAKRDSDSLRHMVHDGYRDGAIQDFTILCVAGYA
jgi:hypothetical protein